MKRGAVGDIHPTPTPEYGHVDTNPTQLLYIRRTNLVLEHRYVYVGFMAIVDRQNIDLRVHERGVGETKACGTGACAAVVAGQQKSLLDEHVNVQLPGGQVMVSWRGGDSPVWLTGNAELISEGTMDLED